MEHAETLKLYKSLLDQDVSHCIIRPILQIPQRCNIKEQSKQAAPSRNAIESNPLNSVVSDLSISHGYCDEIVQDRRDDHREECRS